jgi:hypothetical protein
MFRTVILGFSVTSVLLGACSGPAEQTSPLAATAFELQQLVTAMNADIVAADAAAATGEPSLEKERARFDAWLAARDEFLADLRDLEPPASLADFFARGIAVVTKLRDTTEDLSDVAHAASTLDEMGAALQAGPIAAYEEADQHALALCLEVEAVFIERLQGAVAFTSPWLQTSSSSSSSEAIEIDLGCYAQP